MKATRWAAAGGVVALGAAVAAAQFPSIPHPQMPHLPEVRLRIPEVRIPPIHLPPVLDGHKTNKWEIRHNLEKDGWWVAYGKEIGYQEYAEFSGAVATSVATDNPGPAMAYLKGLVVESIRVLAENAGREFGDRLRGVAERELVAVFNDAMRHGRVRTIRIPGAEVQLGMATYNRSESGVPLPNTFQPYMRMRLVFDSGPGGQPARYHWVTTVYNPSDVPLNYKFNYGGGWQDYSVNARGWRWHSHDSAAPPDFRIDFDTGPPTGHRRKEYHLNTHRLALGVTPAEGKGEPYTFRFDAVKGWDVFRGRP